MKRFAFYTKIAKLCFLCLSMAAMPQQSMAQVDAEHAGFYGEGMTIEELNQLQSSGKKPASFSIISKRTCFSTPEASGAREQRHSQSDCHCL